MPDNSSTPEEITKAESLCHAQEGPSFPSNFPDFNGVLRVLMKPQNLDSLPTAAKDKRCPLEKRSHPSSRASNPG